MVATLLSLGLLVYFAGKTLRAELTGLNPGAQLQLKSVHPARNGWIAVNYNIIGEGQLARARFKLHPWGEIDVEK
jgi:hypothetical protein